MEITSVNNELVKETVKLQQKKYRDKEQKFILEGDKCVREAFLQELKLKEFSYCRKKRRIIHFCRIRLF